MKPKGIIMTADVVRAIMRGTKTQVRVILKPQPSEDWTPHSYGDVHKMVNGEFVLKGGEPVVIGWGACNECGDEAYITRDKPGDVLYVKEKWCELGDIDDNWQIIDGTNKYYYSADGYNPTPYIAFLNPKTGVLDVERGYPFWRPSSIMPREAARIWLRVTDIKIERVQNISEEDAIAEGISSNDAMDIGAEHFHPTYYNPDNNPPILDYIGAFSVLWNKIHGAGAWDRNPWVEVVSFERIEKPEDL